MTPFAALASLLWRRPPAETEASWKIPCDLTEGEWKALKTLRGDAAWEIWLKALDFSVKFHGEALLSASTDESLHFHRGVIHGVRQAALLVDRLKQEEDAFLDARTRHAAERTGRAGRTTTLFGSPGWAKRS